MLENTLVAYATPASRKMDYITRKGGRSNRLRNSYASQLGNIVVALASTNKLNQSAHTLSY